MLTFRKIDDPDERNRYRLKVTDENGGVCGFLVMSEENADEFMEFITREQGEVEKVPLKAIQAVAGPSFAVVIDDHGNTWSVDKGPDGAVKALKIELG